MKYAVPAVTKCSLFLLFLAGFPAAAAPFGVAAGYNVFVTGNLEQSNTDIQGRLAAGGNVVLSSFRIGDALSYDPTRLDLVVGGNLSLTDGEVARGSGTYAGAGSFTRASAPRGTLTQTAPYVDFAAAATSLIRDSDFYAALGGVNAVREYSSLNLIGTSTGLNIFRLAEDAFDGVNSLNITAPAGSTVLVNVAGTNHTVKDGMSVSGTGKDKVLFNFFEAQSLTLQSIGFFGSILAPEAAITFNNGNVDGSLIAASLQGTGESHHLLFTGNLPPTDVPEPAAWCMTGIALVALLLARLLNRPYPQQVPVSKQRYSRR